MSDETNESRAFSFFPLCLNIGILIASFIGGTFGNATRFPFLAKMPLFQTFPYLLPNLLAAIFPLFSATAAFFYLKETLVKTSPGDGSQTAEAGEETSYKALLTPHINALMFSFAVLSLLAAAQLALIPLFCFTPIRDGGLGFGESEIGNAMSIRAVATIVVQLFCFPFLQRRYGTLKLFRWLMMLWVPSYGILPFLNVLAKEDKIGAVWVGLSAARVLSAIANMAFGESGVSHAALPLADGAPVCNLLMTNAAAPSRHLLGAINGASKPLPSSTVLMIALSPRLLTSRPIARPYRRTRRRLGSFRGQHRPQAHHRRQRRLGGLHGCGGRRGGVGVHDPEDREVIERGWSVEVENVAIYEMQIGNRGGRWRDLIEVFLPSVLVRA